MKENAHLWDFPQFLSVLKKPPRDTHLPVSFISGMNFPALWGGGREVGGIENPFWMKHWIKCQWKVDIQNTHSHMDNLGRSGDGGARFPAQFMEQLPVLPIWTLFSRNSVLVIVSSHFNIPHDTQGTGRVGKRWSPRKRGSFVAKIVTARTERGISCLLYFSFYMPSQVTAELSQQVRQRHRMPQHWECQHLLCRLHH